MIGMLARYLTLILLGISGLSLFYLVFTPLTVSPVYWGVNVLVSIGALGEVLFYPGNVMLVDNVWARIVPACIAGAAYYLLVILNLSTPMKVTKRVNSLLFILLTFLTINSLRIITFVYLFSRGFEYFDLAHTATWYFGSTVLVMLVWFSNVLIFRIKAFPVFSDLNMILKDMKKRPVTVHHPHSAHHQGSHNAHQAHQEAHDAHHHGHHGSHHHGHHHERKH